MQYYDNEDDCCDNDDDDDHHHCHYALHTKAKNSNAKILYKCGWTVAGCYKKGQDRMS